MAEPRLLIQQLIITIKNGGTSRHFLLPLHPFSGNYIRECYGRLRKIKEDRGR
jgi:hypothetical protein